MSAFNTFLLDCLASSLQCSLQCWAQKRHCKHSLRFNFLNSPMRCVFVYLGLQQLPRLRLHRWWWHGLLFGGIFIDIRGAYCFATHCFISSDSMCHLSMCNLVCQPHWLICFLHIRKVLEKSQQSFLILLLAALEWCRLYLNRITDAVISDLYISCISASENPWRWGSIDGELTWSNLVGCNDFQPNNVPEWRIVCSMHFLWMDLQHLCTVAFDAELKRSNAQILRDLMCLAHLWIVSLFTWDCNNCLYCYCIGDDGMGCCLAEYS